ncbi:hypothetical protein HCN56_24490, partial [Streptomyces lonarensis]|nr:hypothetical protein [Streptomyces lonarensis]
PGGDGGPPGGGTGGDTPPGSGRTAGGNAESPEEHDGDGPAGPRPPSDGELPRQQRPSEVSAGGRPTRG